MKNRQWRLARFAEGMPQATDWVLSEAEMPEAGPGQLLVRALYLDVAPYMRGRISPRQNYAAGVRPGDVMVGGGIGEVVQSNAENFRPGDVVVSDFSFGWQEFAAVPATAVRCIRPEIAPLPYWLDAFGLNGLTAYFALFETGNMKAGETVAVSAAAGSVGQIAGQLARLAGCRTVGFTSSEEKAAWCKSSGYDEVINYRLAGDLEETVRFVCPGGVDLFIDNTAGVIHDAVMTNLAEHARVVMVGTASLADKFEQADIGHRFLRQILVKRAIVRGFLFLDHQTRHEAARSRLVQWYEDGVLRSKFDILEGIENMPEAFLRLLTSKNLGKQLVRVGVEG